MYVGTVDVDGKTYQTVFYAGPTREQSETPHRIEVLEAHLLDFEGDLYGKTLKARIHKMVRPDKDIPYKSWKSFKEVMTKQVKEDLEAAKKILTPDSRR